MMSTLLRFRAVVAASVFLFAPCASTQLRAQAQATMSEPAPEPIILREGDELQITFPGAPTLNTQQRIRSDGRITLDLVGEVMAVGVTPLQFQERLLKLFSTQLVSK